MYKVLLADDEAIIRKGIIQLIPWQSLSCQLVYDCGSGQEALDFLANNAVDIVITDIKMPHTNGLDLLEQLQTHYPQIKTIMLTAYSDFTYAQKALRWGAVDFIVKNDFLTELPRSLKAVTASLDALSRAGTAQENATTDPDASLLQAQLFSTEKISLSSGETNRWSGFTYLVVACEILAAEKIYSPAECLKKLQQFLQIPLQSFGYRLFLLQPQPWLILLFRPSEEKFSVEEGQKVMEDASRIVEEFMGVQLYMGFSSGCYPFHRLQEARIQAQTALGQIADKDHKFQVFEAKTISVKEYPSLSQLSQRLCQMVLNNQPTEALIALKEWENCLMHCQRPLTNSRLRLINLFADIFHQLGESYLLPEVGSLEQAFHETLENCCSLYSLFLSAEKQLQDIHLLLGSLTAEKHYLIQATQRYLRDHYRENLTLTTLSQQVHVSPSYLSRLYKNKTGESLTTAVNRLRIEKAQELLADPALKIYQVARLIGFEDAGYFANLFYKMSGVTPSEYRFHLGEIENNLHRIIVQD